MKFNVWKLNAWITIVICMTLEIPLKAYSQSSFAKEGLEMLINSLPIALLLLFFVLIASILIKYRDLYYTRKIIDHLYWIIGSYVIFAITLSFYLCFPRENFLVIYISLGWFCVFLALFLLLRINTLIYFVRIENKRERLAKAKKIKIVSIQFNPAIDKISDFIYSEINSFFPVFTEYELGEYFEVKNIIFDSIVIKKIELELSAKPPKIGYKPPITIGYIYQFKNNDNLETLEKELIDDFNKRIDNDETREWLNSYGEKISLTDNVNT